MWIQPAPNLSCRKKMSTKICRVRHLPGRCLIINVQGGMDEHVKTRIRKAKRAFLQLQTIWKSRELPQRTKTRISNSNIKAVLLYLWWRGMENNKSYRHQSTNFHQHLPPGNPEGALAREDQQYQPVRQQIRTWNEKKEIEPDMALVPRHKHSLGTPRGSKRRRGRARKTGRWDLLVDTERMGITWNQLEAKAQDRGTLKVSRRSTAYTPGGVVGLSK